MTRDQSVTRARLGDGHVAVFVDVDPDQLTVDQQAALMVLRAALAELSDPQQSLSDAPEPRPAPLTLGTRREAPQRPPVTEHGPFPVGQPRQEAPEKAPECPAERLNPPPEGQHARHGGRPTRTAALSAVPTPRRTATEETP